MKQFTRIIAVLFFLFSFILCSLNSKGQSANQSLIGYWQNWNDFQAPYIQLDNIDARYTIVNVSFAVPKTGTDYKMEFIPDQVSPATLISQIQTLHSQGRKVIISIGGANAAITLSNIAERDTFVNTMLGIINTYGFDGIDLDLEGSSVLVSGGTIANPTDPSIINLINAVKQIMAGYYIQHGHRLFLTMAPETAFVQGGQSAYGGIWGAYLPVIHALRDSIEILYVQLYNSGSMYGIDGNIYTQGTADFIVAMTEAVIHGFNTGGGSFTGLPSNKIAVALPACTSAAGGGYTAPAVVKSALDYLRGYGPKPGTYTLNNAAGYPALRGMMTWSINWDAVSTCGGVYSFAANYQSIFGNGCLTCPVPDNLTTTSITTATAKLNWVTNNCSIGYRVRYKAVGSSAWIIKSINSNTGIKKITGLMNNTAYQWQVRSKCNTSPLIWSAWTDTVNFTTPVFRFEEVAENEKQIISISVFPNPVQNILYLNIANAAAHSNLMLRNVLGEVIYSITLVDGGDIEKEINLSSLPASVYFVSLTSNNKTVSQKFMKN